MSASGLPTDAWVVIGAIIGIAVLICLSFIANVLYYEKSFRKLVGQVKALRATLTGHEARPPQPIRRAEPMGAAWEEMYAHKRRQDAKARKDSQSKRRGSGSRRVA